jgi:hypothetical protein
MKEHALPQDVTGYRFHIIGNMTLKQFAEVAVGCVIGFLIYSTNLPNLIKYPLILISAGIGAAMAFVPFEERPLDQWLLSAFKVLYRPTQFYWQRTPKIPEPFLYEPTDKTKSIVQEVDLTPARRQRVKEYLRSIDTNTNQDAVEQYTQARVGEVMTIFQDGLQFPSGGFDGNLAQPLPEPALSASLTTTPSSADQIPNLLAVAQLENLPSVTTQAPPAPTPNYQTATLPVVEPLPTTSASSTAAPATKPEVIIPEQTTISLEPTVQTEPAQVATAQEPTQAGAFVTDQFLPQTPVVDQLANFNTALQTNIAIPDTPTQANLIVGVVTDAQQQPLNNAIVEILTADGFPARAVRTNVLGQFFTTTPLGNGEYVINVEKEGLNFPTQQVPLSGQVVPPVVISSN